MDKQKIFLKLDNQIISGDEISWDMWFCDMTIESGSKELIEFMKAQDIKSNLENSTGIFAQWKKSNFTSWENCLILAMVDEILAFRTLIGTPKDDIQGRTS